jgi:hypothetical protein
LSKGNPGLTVLPITVKQRYLTVFATTESKAKKERDLEMTWNLRSGRMSPAFDSNLRYSSQVLRNIKLTFFGRSHKKFDGF